MCHEASIRCLARPTGLDVVHGARRRGRSPASAARLLDLAQPTRGSPDVTTDPIAQLQQRLRDFSAARDWEQFHTPKNLTMALAGEVGELLEIFQWLTPEQAEQVMDSERADDVRDELADVVIYLARLADVLDVDLTQVAVAKLDRSEDRYPAEVVRGRADVRIDD
jgi:dCTP diphosphatase